MHNLLFLKPVWFFHSRGLVVLDIQLGIMWLRILLVKHYPLQLLQSVRSPFFSSFTIRFTFQSSGASSEFHILCRILVSTFGVTCSSALNRSACTRSVPGAILTSGSEGGSMSRKSSDGGMFASVEGLSRLKTASKCSFQWLSFSYLLVMVSTFFVLTTVSVDVKPPVSVFVIQHSAPISCLAAAVSALAA